jgi:hypothetical protein
MATVKTLEQRMVAAAQKSARDSDAAKAMREYEAEKLRVDANTTRLRALRLEKEAKDAADAKAAADVAAAKPKTAKSKAVSRKKDQTPA